jgi:hypothetical protein
MSVFDFPHVLTALLLVLFVSSEWFIWYGRWEEGYRAGYIARIKEEHI